MMVSAKRERLPREKVTAILIDKVDWLTDAATGKRISLLRESGFSIVPNVKRVQLGNNVAAAHNSR